MTITIERTQKIQNLYIYIYTHTHKTEKYKRKMCYHQKNNSDVKTFKRLKNIKELDDSLLRNYWNKTKYVWLNNGEI